MAIQFDTVVNFLQEYGQLYIKGNKINMRCMLCGDSKKSLRKRRLTVVCDNNVSFYSCLNCGRSGTFAELVSELKGISIGEAIKSVETIEFEDVKKTLTLHPSASESEQPKLKDETNLTTILEDCISLDTEVTSYIDKQYKRALGKFLWDRKIPLDYKIFVARSGKYKGRFIIPIYHGNEIVYFQGRAINTNSDLKFKNPTVEKTGIIMNVEHFKRDKFIIVTEGIIDAMMVEDHQGTCVLGGSVSDDFLSELYKYTNKGIIIAVDNDERGNKEREKLSNESKYNKQLYYFVPPNPYKDLNEFKINKSDIDMYEYITSNKKDYFNYMILGKL